MKTTTRAQRKSLKRQLKSYAWKEMKNLDEYAGREVENLIFGFTGELGSLFTGVKSTTPKKR